MKYVMFGFAAIAVIALSIVGIETVNKKAARENELNNALQVAAKEALIQCSKDEASGNKSEDDKLLKETFSDNLLSQIQAGDDSYDENLALDIDFFGLDYEKGLLGVRVSESYTGAFGRVCEVSSETCALIDRKMAA